MFSQQLFQAMELPTVAFECFWKRFKEEYLEDLKSAHQPKRRAEVFKSGRRMLIAGSHPKQGLVAILLRLYRATRILTSDNVHARLKWELARF